MSDKPKIYGTCTAGCLWETVHKSDFEKSAAYIKQYPDTNGYYVLEMGKTYLLNRTGSSPLIGTWQVTPVHLGNPDYGIAKAGAVTFGDDYDKYNTIYKVRVLDCAWVPYVNASGFNGNIVYEINGEQTTASFSDGADYLVDSAFAKIFVLGSAVSEVLLVNEHAEIRAKDAYEIAVEEGFEGTRAEWLESLKQGQKGPQGPQGYTPVKGVDYYTENDKAEFSEYIASELAKRGQLKPEFANSIAECTDTTKLYVLPDGYIYAYMLTEKEVVSGTSYTNRLPLSINSDGSDYVGDNGEDGYRVGYRYSASSAAEKAASGYDCVGFIPAKAGDVIRISNITQPTASNDGAGYATVYFFDSAFAKTQGVLELKNQTYSNGVLSFTVLSYDTIAYFKATLMGVSANTIITVNEEITEGNGDTTTVTEYAWASTGHAFVPADYEHRILAIEDETAKIKGIEERLENIESGVSDLTDSEKIELTKTWDAPIYDANIPVFELSAEKNEISESEKTVAAVYAKYDALMAKHPNYITKTDLGVCSDGVTHVYRYDFREPEPHRGTTGKKEWSETKAKAIIVSGIHWEWGGIFALYHALEELADNPELFHLRRNTHLIVLPVCNPYAVANMSVRNANQVEIHRNFEVDFIYPSESGYIEAGEIHHGGTAPLSEVETQYIDNIMKENTDSAFFLTCHSNQYDEVYGTGFTWASPATYYMCNMHYRIVDKLSDAWMKKYGNELAAGIADYRTENTPEWDNRLGSAYLSTTNGTETKQATKYGIQATNIEITDAFLVHGTKANTEKALSSFTVSRGAEVYLNFFLTAFGVYDPKDKNEYAPKYNESNLPNDTYYSVVTNTTNCTIDNHATQVLSGSSYSITVTANEGYEIVTIQVAMGGVNITSSVVSGNTVYIEKATGNITIGVLTTEA